MTCFHRLMNLKGGRGYREDVIPAPMKVIHAPLINHPGSQMKKGKRYKSLYLPAWTIVVAVIILFFVIAISTYRNMSRERGRMEESLIREAQVIIRAIEAGVRADIPSSSGAGRLQKLVEEVAREPEIASIAIFDHEGVPVAVSSSARPLTIPDGGNVSEMVSLKILLQQQGMVTRYRQFAREERVFEVIQRFRPYPVERLRTAQTVEAKETGRTSAHDPMIVLSLRLATAETARLQDRHHNLLMAAILVILGTGALYFVFIVQNYYLVDNRLVRMQSYTENVLESMADGLLSIDRNGKIVTLNRQAAEIVGVEPAAMAGRNIADFLGGAWEEAFSSGGGGKVVKEKQMELRRQDRDVKTPISVSVTPLKDDAGQKQGQVLLIKDLSELRALQEKVRRSERLASLGRLAAGVAHEIRNPLSSIKGFAQYFAKRFKGYEEEEGYAIVMVKEVDRLNRVITELLDFAGPKAPHLEAHRLEDIADHVLKLLASDLTERKIAIFRDYHENLPAAYVDRDQMSQVFINIILNSMESMKGGGKIMLSLQRAESPDAAAIVLADTGDGIPEEDLEKIFEPFFSRKRKGTGLGLAVVHQIIEGHGGDITVESRPGEGTRFRMVLPFSGTRKEHA